MAGVTLKVEGNVPIDGNIAEQAEGLVHTISAHPVESFFLVMLVALVLILLPGGVGPSYIKYRGANRRQEQTRLVDVKDISNKLSKRAKRRKRGRKKGQKR